MKTIGRYGESSVTPVQDFSYVLAGNRVSRTAGTSGTYRYDANGNMTHGPYRDRGISYNAIGRVSLVTDMEPAPVCRIGWTADGVKCSTVAENGPGLVYAGDMVFSRTSSGALSGFGIDYMDFGARLYDPVICRWLSQDPLAEKYASFTPYGYCSNNPICRIDPTGETDYFSVNGEYLFNDNIDNCEMRVITSEDIMHDYFDMTLEEKKRPQKEIDAILAQRKHGSWDNTTKSFKAAVARYEERMRKKLLTIHIN